MGRSDYKYASWPPHLATASMITIHLVGLLVLATSTTPLTDMENNLFSNNGVTFRMHSLGLKYQLQEQKQITSKIQ